MPEHGRLFLVTGTDDDTRSEVGLALARTLPRAVFVDGGMIGEAVVSGREPMTDPPTLPAIEQLLLRYAGALMLADVYRSAGFDAVIVDTAVGDHLTDFLELADPEPLHLVMLDPADPPPERIGLWLRPGGESVGATVERILAGVDRALVVRD